MRKPLIRGSIAAAFLAVVSATGAQAQLTLLSNPLCTAWNQATAGYTQCAGAFDGNNKNQDVAGWLSSNWGFTTTSNIEVSSGGNPTGTLTLPGVSGIFVIALKAADKFSLYEFDTGGAIWTSLAFNTIGVSVNKIDKAQDLSHATLYLGPTTPPITTTPEPVSTTLLATGLLGIVGARRRRRRGGDVVTDA